MKKKNEEILHQYSKKKYTDTLLEDIVNNIDNKS